MLQLKVLISKLLAIDGLAPGTVPLREVTSLTHEARNDAVKLATLETESLLTRAEGTEILTGLRHDITSQLHDDPSCSLTADINVEEASSGHVVGEETRRRCEEMEETNRREGGES